jgi:hypothetical protein
MAGGMIDRYLLLPSSGLKLGAKNSSEILVYANQLHTSQMMVILRNKHKALNSKSQGKRQQRKLIFKWKDNIKIGVQRQTLRE